MKPRILILDCDYDTNEFNTARMIDHLLPNSEVKIIRVCENQFPSLREINNFHGFIINGSRASVYDNIEWINNLKTLTKAIVKLNKPILGVCFGFQLLAELFDGKTIHSESFEEGFREVRLNKEGINSELFINIPNSFITYHSHRDIVVKLPKDAKLLADNDFGIQAYTIPNLNIYAVQFHPEIKSEIAIKIAIRDNKDVNTLRERAKRYSSIITSIFSNFQNILNID